MKITREMVVELNTELAIMGCSFRYRYDEAGYSGNPHIEIALPSMNFINYVSIHPKNEFFDWLKMWFRMKGIELSSNNDRSILWSKSGWDKEEDTVCGWIIKVTDDKYYYKCSKCGDQYAVLRKVLGHSYGEEYKYIKNYCSCCGRKMEFTEHED